MNKSELLRCAPLRLPVADFHTHESSLLCCWHYVLLHFPDAVGNSTCSGGFAIGTDGHVAGEADTDPSGNYKFDGLLPGSYAVTFGLSGAGDIAPLLPQIYPQHDFDATMLGSDFSNLLVIGDE